MDKLTFLRQLRRFDVVQSLFDYARFISRVICLISVLHPTSPDACVTNQVTVSRTVAASNGYVWSVTFDTPTVVDGVTNAGNQPMLHANGRMLGATTTPSPATLGIEVRCALLYCRIQQCHTLRLLGGIDIQRFGREAHRNKRLMQRQTRMRVAPPSRSFQFFPRL